MLREQDCLDAGLGSHRLGVEHAMFEDEDASWATAPSRDCRQGLLWRFPNSPDADDQTWTFYDPEGGVTDGR